MASPGTTQPWPSRAAAWSPALPQMGTPARASRPFMPGATRPYSAELGTGAGSMDIGTPRTRQRSSSQRRRSMSKSMVREQLE